MATIFRNGVPYGNGGGNSGESWITDIPEMHRNIFRGKYLGASVTSAQLAAIDNGTFDDLFVGDYWTINGVNWRIADIDYCQSVSKHHLLMLPDSGLYETQLHNSRASNLFYINSAMFSTNLEQAKTTIAAGFPGMVLPFTELYGTSVSDITERTVTAEIPYPMMITGSIIMMSASYIGRTHSKFQQQLALIRLCPRFIASDGIYWLRELSNGSQYAYLACDGGRLGANEVQNQANVRPYFLLGVE